MNVYAERSGSDLPFESVFNKGTPHRSGARLPGMPTIDEPFYLPGDDYVVAPADAVRAVPKFSRRERLVELVTSGQNVAFNENIANRLWYLVMGRGLVHPLDMMHADNPAVDPELLRLLGQRFAADGFNIRGFIRELLLSDLYQRVFDLPRQTPQVAPVLAQQLPSLEQELSVRTDERRTKGTEYDAATTAFEAAEAALIPVAQELDAARNTYAEAAKKTSEARAASAAAAAAYQTKQQAVMALISSVESATAAAGILPEDAELAAVQARLSARLQQLQGEIPTLKTSSEEKLAAVAPLEAAQETARGTVEQVRLKSEPLKSALRHAEQAVVAARAAAQFAASQVAALEGRIQSTQLVVALGGLTESIAVAQAAVQKHEAEQSALATRVAQGTATVADLQSQLEQARQAEANAAAALASADASVSQAQSLQGKLTEAMVSLQNAQAAVQGDAAIQVLISTMDQRLTLLKSQTVTAQTIQMQRTTEKQAAGAAVMEITAAVDRMAAELKAAESAMLTTQQALQAVRDELSTRQQELLESESMVAQNWAERFQLANLKPLTPEQLCWSVFRVTTVYDRYLATEAAELEKASPLSDAQKQDPAALAARSIEIEQRTFDKLKGNLGTWIQFYGGGAGQPQGDFFASADQALFTSNGGAVNSWVVPAGDNAAERIVKATDAVTAAEELYLGILTRMPEPEEIEEVAAVLQARTDRSLAAQELVWGLLNSAEFRFNH